MADTNNNGEQQVIKTDSNLPILFANGYPTSLESMKIESLELFLPFLVECSKENQDITSDQPIQAPSWWPKKELPFTVPLERPRRLKNNVLWEAKLKEVVKQCYISSGNEYLLTYSESLSQIPTDKLQLITESNLTTSLYKKEKGEKKLLITFRNENMTYDKRKRLQLWHRTQPAGMISAEENLDDEEEEEATFQIILCEYCDAEFYSDEAVRIHEMSCRDRTDSDQERDYAEENIIENIIISDDDDDGGEGSSDSNIACRTQEGFMSQFGLTNLNTMQLPNSRSNRSFERIASPKKKRSQGRTRKVINKKEIENERSIPFSSPLGQVILKKKRLDKEVDEIYIQRRQEEVDVHCRAKPLMKIPPRIKNKLQVSENNAVFREMRKHRHYYWPKRQLDPYCKHVNFEFLNRSLIKRTKPLSVVVDNLTDEKINMILEKFRRKQEEKKRREMESCIAVLDSDDSEDSNLPSTSGFNLINGTSSFNIFSQQQSSITLERRGSQTQILQSNHEVSIVSHSSPARRTITSTPLNSQLSIEGLNSSYDHGNPVSNVTNNVIHWLNSVDSDAVLS